MDEQSVTRFWNNYTNLLKRYGVKPTMLPWYVQHAKNYIAVHPGQRLATHSDADVEAYLQEIGRSTLLKDWQFQQIVHALQVLFLDLIKTPWAMVFPWQDRRTAARSLPVTHATVARDYDTASQQGAVNTAGTIAQGADSGAISQFQAAFPKHAQALITEIRLRHYSIRTEQAYLLWLARFVLFHKRRDPGDLGSEAIVAFLEYLVITRRVSASTQSQALNALVFFYCQVLKREDIELGPFAHSKKPRHVPVVLARGEVARLLEKISNPTALLMAKLLYGCGLRLMECVRLRVMDIDFGYQLGRMGGAQRNPSP